MNERGERKRTYLLFLSGFSMLCFIIFEFAGNFCQMTAHLAQAGNEGISVIGKIMFGKEGLNIRGHL